MVRQTLNAVVLSFPLNNWWRHINKSFRGWLVTLHIVTSFRLSKTQPWLLELAPWRSDTEQGLCARQTPNFARTKQTSSSNFTLISCYADLSSIRKADAIHWIWSFQSSNTLFEFDADISVQFPCMTGQPEPEPEPDAASCGLKKLARKLPRS